MTRRRQNNRVEEEAEGDEVFELWTEVPSSFLYLLHSDFGGKKKEGKKIHCRERERGKERVSRKSFGLSIADCSPLEEIRIETSRSIEAKRADEMFGLQDHYRIRNITQIRCASL